MYSLISYQAASRHRIFTIYILQCDPQLARTYADMFECTHDDIFILSTCMQFMYEFRTVPLQWKQISNSSVLCLRPPPPEPTCSLTIRACRHVNETFRETFRERKLQERNLQLLGHIFRLRHLLDRPLIHRCLSHDRH